MGRRRLHIFKTLLERRRDTGLDALGREDKERRKGKVAIGAWNTRSMGATSGEIDPEMKMNIFMSIWNARKWKAVLLSVTAHKRSGRRTETAHKRSGSKKSNHMATRLRAQRTARQ